MADFLLKLYISLGLKLISIKYIIAFTTRVQFSEFGDILMNDRYSNKSSKLHQTLSKGIGVQCVGRFSKSPSNIRAKFVTDSDKAVKLISSASFVGCDVLSPNLLLVYQNKKKELVSSNCLMLFQILNWSHYMLYHTYYCVMMPLFFEE